MKVKERLQHGFTATGILAALAIAMMPTISFAQIVTASEPYEAAAESTGKPSDEKQLFADLAAHDQVFLRARRAIAQGDIAAAEAIAQSLESAGPISSRRGESLPLLRALITKQKQLADPQFQKKADYNRQAADFLLQQARSLLEYQDFETAQLLANHARKFPVDFSAGSNSPDSVLAAIASARTGSADPLDASNPVSEVLRLMSQAQLAFDQGKLDLASSLTTRAKALGVEDTKLPANQVLPWQLELKIQEAMKSGGDVIAASFESTTADDVVVQAAYDPDSDTTKNVQVAGVAHAGADAEVARISEFTPIPNKANQLYQAGVQALAANDREAAREYLQMAWQYRTQLDDATEQSLQDQLNGLVDPPANHSTSSEFQALPQPPADAITDAITDANTTDANTDAGNPDNAAPTMGLATDDQEKLFRKLQSEVLSQRAAAERMRERDPRSAIELLTQIRSRIVDSEISETNKRPLLKFIDRDITEFQKYIARNLSDIQLQEDNASRLASVSESREQRYNAELQIQKLVEDFNDLMDQQRYAEAGMVARQAEALAPDSEIVSLLKEKAAIAINLATMEDIQGRKRDTFFDRLADVDEDTINDRSETDPLGFDKSDRYSRNRLRRSEWLANRQYRSEAERKIWNTLKNEQVQGHYQGTLADAIRQLAEQSGVNIIFDDVSLNAESISTNRPVDFPIQQPISLQSALNIMLGSSGLVFIVEDEVVKVVSRDAQRRDVKPQTYYVGDLVTPIQNFTSSLSMNFLSPNGQVGSNGFISQGGMAVPLANQSAGSISPMQMAGQSAAAVAPGSALAQQLPGLPGVGTRPILGGGPIQTGNPTYTSTGPHAPGGVTQADFQPLINLIRNTIDPDGWDDTNGDGTIQAFVPNLSLIVSQTQAVQDQIQDLLKQLRELNDVQIVVEVRFVSLADSFFERIGVDFDFNINDNSGLDPNAIPEEVSPSSTVGLTNSDQAGPAFSPDLDIPFRQGSFVSSAPLFGGFDPGSAASFGFAILSDIEVFFLLNAATGDARTNITQAPTVTMFNGQVASVNDGAQVPFVTSVTPVVGDFAVAQQPIITLLPEGASLNVQGTVSHDRKSVRMTLVPFFSQITNVDTFTFDGSTTTQRATDENFIDDLINAALGMEPEEDDGFIEVETTTQGVTVQLPTLGFTTVSTVVSVPDGGTILIGGVKRQSEQRLERGVPFLSNVPYVSRLFKNVGIGRETSSLMMMVTPRIIIQQEEEEDQVGTVN